MAALPQAIPKFNNLFLYYQQIKLTANRCF